MKLRKIVHNYTMIIDEYTDIFARFLETIPEYNDKLAENYTPQALMLTKHLSFDCLFSQDNEVVAFCGVFNNGRYPDEVQRILNRTYINPKFRNYTLSGPGPIWSCTQHIVPYQLQQYDIKTAFVSVEGRKGKSFLQRWIQRAPSRDSEWKLSKRLYQVSDARNKGCYQYIAYSGDLWTDDSVTLEEWYDLPEK